MPIDLYSKRKNAGSNDSDVYQYDELPQPLRVQIVHLLRRYVQENRYFRDALATRFFKPIVECLCEEYGIFQLNNARALRSASSDYQTELERFIIEEDDADRVLDAVELILRKLENEEAVSDLRHRFNEHRVGYEFSNQCIIRIDNQFIHAEAVVPSLSLLSDPAFAGAEEEFLDAHKHYRHQDYDSCLNECLKSLESTLKTICDKRGWHYQPKDTAQKLLQLCFDNELIPEFWQSHFSALRSCIESGVPTGRNKLSGHGSGSEPRVIPQHIASFMLHETAANIKLLVDAEKALV